MTNTVRCGRFSSLVSLSYDHTDGTVRNFDFRQADGYAKAGYDFSDSWRAYADYTLMNFRGNDPIYPTLSNPSIRVSTYYSDHPTSLQLQFGLRYDLP